MDGRVTRAITAVAAALLAGCHGEPSPPHPIATLYAQEADAACPCFAPSMGFDSPEACRAGYLTDYVGTSRERLVCLQSLEDAHPTEVGPVASCWVDGERDFLGCVSELPCSDSSGFASCESELYDALGACPTLSSELWDEWDRCEEEP